MTSTGDSWRLGHRPALDGLRGVAILLVVIGHGAVNYQLGGLAAAGVTLFFALSGYLITGNLLVEQARHGRMRLARFYTRRLTRLAPSLFVMVAVVTLIAGAPWQAVVSALTWTTDLAVLARWPLGMFGLTWSLGVEEQFYLVWPLLLGALLVRRHPLILLGGLIVLLMWWRGWLFMHGAYQWAYSSPETAGSAILAGCFVRMARVRIGPWIGVACLVELAGLGALGSLVHGPAWFGVPMIVTPLAACLVAAADRMSWLAWRPLTFCGVVSYSVYLWHEPGAELFGFAALTPMGTVVGVALGLVAYLFVELPVMRWRARASATSTLSGRAGPLVSQSRGG